MLLILALIAVAVPAGWLATGRPGLSGPDSAVAAAPAPVLLRLGDELDRRQVRQAAARLVRDRQVRQRRLRKERRFLNLPGSVSRATLNSIAACESGGDPRIVSAGGLYHGKYQFSLGTWAAVGGSGSPAEASEAEQDYRAALLYTRSGPGQWPVCGS